MIRTRSYTCPWNRTCKSRKENPQKLKTSREKKDSTKRHHHRHPKRQPAYLAKPDYIANTKKDLSPSTAPRHDDPLSMHRLSYLSSGGGSGKTTRAIELFLLRNPLVFTPPIAWPKRCGPAASRPRPTTASSAGVARLSGRLKGWGRSSFPVWSSATLETFLDWLEGRGVQGQPPPIAGEMPHDWLRGVAQQPANYYEEVEVDHRAKDPILKALKSESACSLIRSSVNRYERCFLFASGGSTSWRPGSHVISSWPRDFWVRDRAQKLLFERHEEYLPETSVPLLYRLEDTRRQNIMVTIPGPSPEGRSNQQELVLNDVIEVPLKYAREVLGGMWGSDWALGYAITVHSSQGLTIADLQKVWLIDDYLQWSNLAYLALSRVEHLSQLQRVVCPPEEGSEGTGTLTEQQLRKVIQRKLVAYQRQDAAKGLRFNLKVDHTLELKEAQSNRCAACNIELLWVYQPKDTQQFSVDRLENTMGHIRDNTRRTCLECNRKRGYAVLNAWGLHPVVAVCQMAPQAALPELSLAVGHRHLAGSTTQARRAWSTSVPAGTLQETTPGQWPAGDHPLVHRAGKGTEHRPPRGLSALWSQEGVQGLQRRAFV